MHYYQILVLLKKIINFMISSFKIKLNNKKDFPNQNNKIFDSIYIYENLISSKTFWITSIYFFLSIILLTGVHMYEYFKCFLC